MSWGDDSVLIAIDNSENGIIASEAKAVNKFRCPVCHEKVYLKKGKLKIAHFAHQKNSDCSSYSEGESIEHLQGKLDLYEWIKNTGVQVELEVFLSEIKQRADILFVHNKDLIAVEFQCSPLSIEEVCKRTRGYHSIGIKVIWIAGSKLAIKGKLTALQRSLIGEDRRKGFYFFHYNVLEKQVWCYSLLEGLGYSVEQTGRCLLDLSTQEKGANIQLKSHTRVISLKEKENKLSKLRLMSLYRNHYYLNFFQLLYESRITLDSLPDEIYHSLTSEWIIKTVSFEWKLRLMLWLRSLPVNVVVTKRLLKTQMNSFIVNKHVIMYHFPNITRSCCEIPFEEFIEVLVQYKCLKKIKDSKWRVNSKHPFFKKTADQ